MLVACGLSTCDCSGGMCALSACTGEGRDIELRHQRNPDVVFDYVRAVEGACRCCELHQHTSTANAMGLPAASTL